MSRILSRISMLTGQISSQALQLVHAHTSSGVMRSNTLSLEIEISGSMPTGGDTTGSPVAAMTSPTFSTISRGSSGLPVACAGHTDVQRPQTVQASVSINCFQVKSSIFTAPKLSSSVSMRFGIGFIAPLGRSRSFRYMFIGDVNMWRNFVVGRIDEEREERDHVRTPQPAVQEHQVVHRPSVDELGEGPADERPLLEARLALRTRCARLRRGTRSPR